MLKVKGKESDKDGKRELVEYVYEYLAYKPLPGGLQHIVLVRGKKPETPSKG